MAGAAFLIYMITCDYITIKVFADKGFHNMSTPIDVLLNPQKIAIIGASADPTKRGFKVIQTLLNARYSGQIFPINPREKEILGIQCYPDLDNVPQRIDLALIYTPANAVLSVIEQCGRNGIGGVAVIASGFSEAGDAGRLLEDRLIEVARKYNVRVLGPNINGIFSSRHNFNAIGWHDIPNGEIAMLCNSGNIPLSILIEAQTQRVAGFSTILSVGNQADVQFHEYLESLGEDVGTKVILSYVEGLKDGRSYLNAAKNVASRKPIVVYKAGRNREGARVAKSHTGSLAGDYAVSRGVLKQAGVTLVDRSDCIFPVAEALSLLPAMKSRNVAVISEGGGILTIATETLVERGMVVPRFSEETVRKVQEILPNSTTVSNPIDVGSGTLPSAQNYGRCAKVVLEDPNIDALLLVGYFGGYSKRYAKSAMTNDGQVGNERDICRELGELMRSVGKPIVVQSYYANSQAEGLRILRQGGVPYCRSVEVAVDCVAAVAEYAEARRRITERSAGKTVKRIESADRLIETCLVHGRKALLEHEAIDLLSAYGISVPKHVLLENKKDIDDLPPHFTDRLVAMKIASKDILHKSDVGGVRLNILGKNAMRVAFDEITANVSSRRGDATIAGILVTPMADKGVELLIGYVHDPQFGPVVMFGLGGVLVEVLRDVAIRALPISPQDAREMISEIKGKYVLEGARGMPAVDIEALVDLLLNISSICEAYPEIKELDLNPVIAHERSYSVVDARIIVQSC